MSNVHLSGKHAQTLLESFSDWGPMTTIVFSSGSVFEFKGPFPKGAVAHGYYNLKGAGDNANAGFEGHLKLDAVASIALVDKLHRGARSLSFVFEDKNGECIFKVFVGRDEHRELIASQVQAFEQLKQTAR
ncbi:heme utilization cystosolic carrier protein HutX [Agaribacterium haliotis]|uniref:heme utilization cystosolic carrier protein HutX n=1 Tax=Agaribacterium haliotis TaxID=2013869 RepID=UPI000BB55DAA|nr:heme utilization cystosolic carrier protein HutX [Agaribacterium haliotis]